MKTSPAQPQPGQDSVPDSAAIADFAETASAKDTQNPSTPASPQTLSAKPATPTPATKTRPKPKKTWQRIKSRLQRKAGVFLAPDGADPDARIAQENLPAPDGLDTWPAGMRFGLGLSLMFAVFLGLSAISDVFMPTFLALCLTVTLRPISSAMVNHRVSPGLAAAVNLVLLFAILGAMVAMMIYALTALITVLPQYTDDITALYNRAVSQINDWGLDTNRFLKPPRSIDPGPAFAWVSSLVSGLSSAGTTAFILVMVSIFVVGDLVVLKHRGEELALHAPGLAKSLGDFNQGVRTYLLWSTVLGLVVAACDYVVMLIVGVPLPFTWAVLAFVANYVPAVGFIFSMIPPLILALLTLGVWEAVVVAVAYAVIAFFFFNVIMPKFAGNAVGLNPTVTFLSLIVWSAVMGPLGALMAVPLTLFMKAIFVDADPRTQWIDVFFRPTDLPAGA